MPRMGTMLDVRPGLYETPVRKHTNRAGTDLHGNRTAPLKRPAMVPVADLTNGPGIGLPACEVDLTGAVGIVVVIVNDGAVGGIESESETGIDHAAVGWGRIDHHVEVVRRDGERDRLATGRLPVFQVAASNVRNVQVAPTIGSLPPHPDQVKETVGPLPDAGGIGVHAAAGPVEQRRIEIPRPGARRLVVRVDQAPALAAAAVTIHEQQCALRGAEEPRISNPLLVGAGHGLHATKRSHVERPVRSKVHERRDVHVPGDVQTPRAIDSQRHVVVRIPAQRGIELRDRPSVFAQLAAGHGHAAFGVVVGGELTVPVRQETEADTMARPDPLDLHGFEDRRP